MYGGNFVMGNTNAQPSPASIAFLVTFPSSTILDPPANQWGSWGTREIEKKDGYTLQQVDQHPSPFDEVDGFLFIQKDRIARLILGVFWGCNIDFAC